ncbi:response regulator [Aliarcobacter cibarius]|uniref:Response regulator n=1 Tax=Aliarcobacter cibarius TaxID=255507 RepID=A0ABY2V3V7_9BACT|nr:response regulator [Aliarcobacter cibarius]TLS95053.1 response regulator [Aliarcobacter cibarius]TLS95449.1 response regulator [Aliarcobacter cibarius]
MNILLIEDDITLNDTIAEYLKFKGDDIESLEDGDKAIEIIDSKVFDLYIIDINIPNINGLDLLKYIRQKDTKTPIIIITASLELENLA